MSPSGFTGMIYVPMKTSHKRILLALAVLVLIAIAGYAIWSAMPREREGRPSIYRNSDFSYIFVYPSNYDLIERGKVSVLVGHRDKEGMDALVETTGIEVRESEYFNSYDEFVLSKIKEFCGIDLPNITRTCTTTASDEEYTASTATVGRKIYLTEVTQNAATGENTTATVGPFFVFDLTSVNPNVQYTAVVVRPATGILAEKIDAALVEKIANTMMISTPKSKSQ